MDTVSAIRDRILHLCAERNITINKLATLSALPPSSVKNILYGRSQDPKIRTIKKICDGLDITLIDFFNSPEFVSLEPEIKQKITVPPLVSLVLLYSDRPDMGTVKIIVIVRPVNWAYIFYSIQISLEEQVRDCHLTSISIVSLIWLC